MIYIVTTGTYSDYTICGVFDTEKEAERFREFHNFDNVEKHDMNPTTPPYALLRYHCVWREEQDRVTTERLSNLPSEYDNDKDIEIDAYKQSDIQEKPLTLRGVVWAHTEEQAEQGWRDRVRAVKAGTILPVWTHCKGTYEVTTLDPKEVPKCVHRCYTHHYLYTFGKLELVNTEEEIT